MIKNYYNIKNAQFTMEKETIDDQDITETPYVYKNLENDFTLTIGEDIEEESQVFFIHADNAHGETYKLNTKFLTYEEARKAMNKIPIYTDVQNHPAWIKIK